MRLRLAAIQLGVLLALLVASPASGVQLVVSVGPASHGLSGREVAAALGGRLVDAIPQIGAYLVEADAVPSRFRLASLPGARVGPARADQLHRTVRDPFRSLQTHLTQLGAEEAWDITFGDPGVVIAIVDTGIEYGHLDLAGKVILGRDVADEDDDPRDTHGHGTFVAGMAGSVTDNEHGGAGVCPLCSLLAVKAVKDGSTQLTKFDSAEAIVWATDHGADVINLSSGSPNSDQAQADAVAYALSKGVTVIASSGNEGTDVVQYPAAYDGVVAVAANDDQNRLWSGSTYGAWVDVAAPGVNVYSTLKDGGYGRNTGTSFAAPVVAGAVGLVLSAAPGLSPAAVAEALLTGTVPLASTSLRRIDLGRVLRRALGGPIEPDPPLALAISPFALSPGAWFVAGYPAATAGERFAVGGRVRRTDTNELLKEGAISCSARAGGQRARLESAVFQKGIARCVWLLPASSGGKLLIGTLSVGYEDGRAERSFSVRIRRR
jgi:thermitase